MTTESTEAGAQYLLLQQKVKELEHSLGLMRAALDAAADGIVITNPSGRITGYNEQYLQMWQLPRELVEVRDHKLVLDVVAKQFKDPLSFRTRVSEIYSRIHADSFDILNLSDGRVLSVSRAFIS